MPKRKKEEEHENLERWLLSYSDFMTLFAAFFIIMFSMASVDATKFKVLSQSLSMAFGTGGGGGGANMMSNFSGTGINESLKISVGEDAEFNAMIKQINKYASEQGLSKSIRSSITERGLVINLADTVLFASGKADLSAHAKDILDHLGEIMFKSGRMIRVEGHTDNVPIHTARYESNWQLSTDRATNVIMYWISKYPAKGPLLSAAGYGEYHPIASNVTPEGKALNRRVEIVLVRVASKEK